MGVQKAKRNAEYLAKIDEGVENPFTGSYDGGGFAIRNFILKDDTRKAMALFGGGTESGVLKNIRLENIDMIGGYSNASFLSIQNMGVICQLNEGVIRSCSFSGSAINTGVETNKGLVS